MKTEEGKLKDKIKSWLRVHSAYFYMPVPMGYGSTTVDFLVCHRGRFVGIETKAPGKKPTARQEFVMKEIRQAGGKIFWCDSFESFLVNAALAGMIEPTDKDYKSSGC